MHPGAADVPALTVRGLCVAVEARSGQSLTREELAAWAKERLAPYKVPRDLRAVAALPRNAMGKVVKPEVAKLFS